MSLKIAHLGRQIRDTNQIFSALKDNVEQVMTKLQDGLMLFTRDSRVVLVSASAEKFLGRPRREILGRRRKKFFPMERSWARWFCPLSRNSVRWCNTNSTPPMAAAFRCRSISFRKRERRLARC